MKKVIVCLSLLSLTTFSYAATAKWTPSTGATGYYLYAKQGETEKFWKIEGGETSEFTFNVKPGEYEFSISAFNDVGESERSDIVPFSIEAYVPKESDPPETPEEPTKPTGLELISEGFAKIWQGIKELI